MKGSVFLVVFAIIAVNCGKTAPSKKMDCKAELRRLDHLTKSALLMNPESFIPKNASSHEQWCKPYMTLSKDMSHYAGRCEKAFSAQVAKIYANALKGPLAFVCKKNKKETLRNFKCMDEDYIKRLYGVIIPLLYNLEYTAKNVSGDQLIPAFCCNFVDAIHTVREKVKPPKCESPNANPSQFVAKMIEGLIGDIFDLICPSLNGKLKVCEEKIPQAMEQIRNPDLEDFDLAKASLIPNVLEIIGKMTQ